jgi:hypothetical protein
VTTDPRARWAEELGVPAGATAGAALSAFLRALPASGFAPAPSRVAALNALAGTGAPTGPDAEIEELLRGEVEAFARSYWELEPGERLTRWAELSRRGADAPRLRELEPGLDVPRRQLSGVVAEALAAVMRELFVLPPRERAVRRNTWLAGAVAEEAKWREAFAAVRRDAPALAALDPQLAAALSESLAALGEAASAGGGGGRRMSIEVALVDFGARMREYQRGRTQAEYEAADSARAKKFLTWSAGTVALLMLSCCIRGLGTRQADRYSAPPPPPPFELKHLTPGVPSGKYPGYPVAEYKPPADPAAPAEVKPLARFTALEVEQFLQYEQSVPARGPARSVPLRYYEWVQAAKPGAGADPQSGGPVGRSCSFDWATIAQCQLYERNHGFQPSAYALWVLAGRPSGPGSYPIPAAPPTNR